MWYNICMDLKNSLNQRLKQTNAKEIDWIINICDSYKLETTVRNLMTGTYIFNDIKNRGAELQISNFRSGWGYFTKEPKAEIQIIVVDDMLAGWIQKDKISFFDDRYGISLASLIPMPQEFDFSLECTHLSEHGGFYEGTTWNCFGCNRELIFNEEKR